MNAYDAEEHGRAQMKRERRRIITYPLRQPDPVLQLALDFQPAQPAQGELTIEARFWAFHEANPQVYQALRELALVEVRRGARIIRTKWLFEQLRAAGGAAVTAEGERYRLNNIYTSRYARLLAGELELAGRIPTRQLKAE